MPPSPLSSRLAQARRQVRAAPEDLWPGFRPAEVPLLSFDGEETHLTGADPQEAGWHPHPDGGWRWPGRHPALVANTAVTLPGGALAAGILADGLAELDARRLAALLVHEAFHVHQAAYPSPAWEADELDGLTYPRTDPGVLHARAEEAACLAAALAHPADWKAHACHALAWRQARFAALAPEHVRYERRMETREGLAHFVETRFLDEVSRLDGEQDASATPREWAYRSGAALAHLLARVGDKWQAQVLAGTALDEALGARVGVAERPSPREALRGAGTQAAAKTAADLAALEAEFRALPGPRLVLELGEPWPVVGFDPLNLHALPGGALLHRRYLHLRGPGGEVELVGFPALAWGDSPLRAHRLEVAGLPLDLQPGLQGDRWQLGGEGVRVHVAPGTVTPDGRGGWTVCSGCAPECAPGRLC
ncbi:hypothetical protein F8S09_08980 [Deinococcus sp. SDU3-2]|uniref:Uncharacterized protein n=1 Tax=Deinococcus terrestris TaxID=2651870 RepID=A0A7X1TRW3_9DEIO|nr:hypothetical protein [Deinococcus terrestris]MPY66821.1 hypothetical protein [Deinococcus terrestris]